VDSAAKSAAIDSLNESCVVTSRKKNHMSLQCPTSFGSETVERMLAGEASFALEPKTGLVASPRVVQVRGF